MGGGLPAGYKVHGSKYTEHCVWELNWQQQFQWLKVWAKGRGQKVDVRWDTRYS